MKKLFLIGLLLPLLFALELEEDKWGIAISIHENIWGEDKLDTTWLCGSSVEVDTMQILKGFVGMDGEIRNWGDMSEAVYDTFYAPQFIIEFKGQKFKVMLSPIIEEEND